MARVFKEKGVKPSAEYMQAENEAYDRIVGAGFRPQGYDFEKKKVCVLSVVNEHTSSEVRKFYYFECWQEACEELVAGE